MAQDLMAAYAATDPAAGRARAEQVMTAAASCPVPEVARLGRTLRAWHGAVLAHFATDGVANGPTEAINLLIETRRRAAHGYRNFTNYRTRLLLARGRSTCDHGAPRILDLPATLPPGPIVSGCEVRLRGGRDGVWAAIVNHTRLALDGSGYDREVRPIAVEAWLPRRGGGWWLVAAHAPPGHARRPRDTAGDRRPGGRAPLAPAAAVDVRRSGAGARAETGRPVRAVGLGVDGEPAVARRGRGRGPVAVDVASRRAAARRCSRRGRRVSFQARRAMRERY